jgi:uncharacterized protein YggE
MNMVRATVRDVEAAGATIDSALEGAGDAARLQWLRFEFSDPERLAMEAREKAVAAARANAEVLARAAGVELGAVLAISELSQGAPQPRMMAMRLEGAAATPVEPGQDVVSISVAVRFAIKT